MWWLCDCTGLYAMHGSEGWSTGVILGGSVGRAGCLGVDVYKDGLQGICWLKVIWGPSWLASAPRQGKAREGSMCTYRLYVHD